MSASRSRTDPYTVEVLKDMLVAVSDEMFASLQRTAKSPIISEVLDFAIGITDADGSLVTQGNGVTGFLGPLGFAVHAVLDKHGASAISPGDVFIVNDPYAGGGTHLSDVSLVTPVFGDDALVAFVASKAHWTEVGGKDAGSWTVDSTEVFQEGLQLPCVRLYEAGRLNQTLVDVIAANVRLPDMTLADMFAQAAANRLGERRLVELCEKHGSDAVRAAMAAIFDHGERMTRAAIARLPKGEFSAQDVMDHDGLGNGPFPVRVRVVVSDDGILCDFTGTAPQAPGPVNATLLGLESSVRSVFKAITDPATPASEGCFRPLEIVCPPGTIFSAERPAPTSAYFEAEAFAADLVWQALAPIVPDRLGAGHFLSVCGIVLATEDPQTGELALLLEPEPGGWGAAADADGESGLFCSGDGETYLTPVEVIEARYGLHVERCELRTDGGGAGRHRGGRGVIRELRADLARFTLTATFGRHLAPPWGAAGGQSGSRNELRFVAADGTVEIVGSCARRPVERGESVVFATGCGGGWGDPLTRPAEAVADDVRGGYIDARHALDDYGVRIDEATLEVLGTTTSRDAAATTDRTSEDQT